MDTEMNENEYCRGMLDRTLRYFTESDVEIVRDTTFAIAGLGGVGAITAELLARWGVRKFRLLDMDRYEPSNLNRQLFATSKTLGRYKVDVAAERIQEINPFAEIEMAFSERVNNDNVHQFVQGAGSVIQNADYPSCKLFYMAARRYKVPLVNGYATVTGGRIQVFDYRHSKCQSMLEPWWQRLKFGNSKALEDRSPQEIEDFDREHVHSTAPSINFVTNLVGCMIVGEAVKFLTGKGNSACYPKYLDFDCFRFTMRMRNSNSLLDGENIGRLFGVLTPKVTGLFRAAARRTF